MPSACEFPNVNPYETSVMEIAGLDLETMSCEGTFKPDLTYITEAHELKVNTEKVEEYFKISDFQHCRYRHIFRNETNDNSFKYSEWSKPFRDKVDLPEDAEFLKVECTNKTFEVVSKTFFCLVPKHNEFDETDLLNFKKRQVISSPKETLNIIMIGMDSLPRNQFLRGCNKTYSYLINSLKSFDLTMHSQLGENTFPNFLPLFGGTSYDEIMKWWSDENYMDTFDLIFSTFEKAGYQTLYTEDWPRIGAFHYLKKGFRRPFARYNTRPLTLAMSDEKDIWEYDSYCAGNQLEMSFLLDYVSRFLQTFRNKPVFVVAMLGKPTHDQPTDAKMFDEHLLNFYRSLNQSGHLNNSLLVSFSDHGVRWGPLRNSRNGVVESRTPYTILTFPGWFLRKYPDVATNLKVNTKRLTSHFDTHATLLDLLYFKSDTPPPLAPLRHGISLFEKISWDRTCVNASIPQEYCLCGYKSLEELHVTSHISKTLASLVIDAINSKTNTSICSVFKLRKVIRILKVTLNENKSTGETEKTIYKVKLAATPGDAVFEGNVYAPVNNIEHFTVHSEIHRLNLYRGQADCMNIAALRPFCYCKNLKTK
ncbi:unnamed protein product [Candidula unifasciata]|uniref:Uncharacterized protein n=1 Tax=Candidula unifasciata TaxID=100452 RepID=A0A8S3ZE10_9EUPU|nr:unnamed protein product [Candidula unifasciata]